MPTESIDTKTLLLDLEPVVEANLNRHLAAAKEWFPHEYVPWSEGTDFDGPLGGQPWDRRSGHRPRLAPGSRRQACSIARARDARGRRPVAEPPPSEPNSLTCSRLRGPG